MVGEGDGIAPWNQDARRGKERSKGGTKYLRYLDSKWISSTRLEAKGLGGFNVKVVLNDSTEAYVERFYNRTVHYVTTGGDTGTATYTLGAEGSDEGQAGSGAVSIDVI